MTGDHENTEGGRSVTWDQWGMERGQTCYDMQSFQNWLKLEFLNI